MHIRRSRKTTISKTAVVIAAPLTGLSVLLQFAKEASDWWDRAKNVAEFYNWAFLRWPQMNAIINSPWLLLIVLICSLVAFIQFSKSDYATAQQKTKRLGRSKLKFDLQTVYLITVRGRLFGRTEYLTRGRAYKGLLASYNTIHPGETHAKIRYFKEPRNLILNVNYACWTDQLTSVVRSSKDQSLDIVVALAKRRWLWLGPWDVCHVEAKCEMSAAKMRRKPQ